MKEVFTKAVWGGVLLLFAYTAVTQVKAIPATGETVEVQNTMVVSPGSIKSNNFNRLKYFAKKVRDKKPVVISYIGGSITQGTGASQYSSNYYWISSQKLKKKIEECGSSLKIYNAAIGGTSSTYGAYRIGAHVLIYEPDLLIIEFSVNDAGNKKAPDGMESMVRQALNVNPEMGIIFLYTSCGKYQKKYYSKGKLPPAVEQHHRIAQHYGILEVLTGLRINQGIISSQFSIDNFFTDGTHPSDIGHKFYADILTNALEPMFGLEVPSKQCPTLIEPLGASLLENARCESITPKDLSDGWIKKNKQWNWFGDVSIYKSDILGALLSFKPTGKNIQLIYTGNIQVSWISDGKEYVENISGETNMPMPAKYTFPTSSYLDEEIRIKVLKGGGEVWGVFSILNTEDNIKNRNWYVDKNNSHSADDNLGTADAPFKNIQAAASKALPGDQVLVYPGVYREWVRPEQGGEKGAPIIYKSVVKHKAVIKGSDLWDESWVRIPTGERIYESSLKNYSFEWENPFLIKLTVGPNDFIPNMEARPVVKELAEWPRTLGQLFVDGTPLIQLVRRTELEKVSGSFIVSKSGEKILVHFPENVLNPKDHDIELSVRPKIFAPIKRNLGYIYVDGFTMEHCANQGPFPQTGAISTRSGHHWRIINNIVRYAKTIGIECGSETWKPEILKHTLSKDKTLIFGGYNQISYNEVNDNGLCGIAGWNHKGTIISHNIVKRNNRLGLQQHYKLNKNIRYEETAGIKVFCCDAVIENNIVKDNNANGIWVDNVFTGTKIRNNIVLNNLGCGIFFELGTGPATIENNIVAFTRGDSNFYDGHGIYAHDASGLTVRQNLICYNKGSGVMMRTVTDRKANKPKGIIAESSNSRITQNIIAGNQTAISLPFPYARSTNNISDYNLVINSSATPFAFVWSKGTYPNHLLKAEMLKLTGGVKLDFMKNMDCWLLNQTMTQQEWGSIMKMDEHTLTYKEKNIRILFQQELSRVIIQVENDSIIQEMHRTFGADHWPGPFGVFDVGKSVFWMKKK
jgi:lysophospholipase L1-like esterase